MHLAFPPAAAPARLHALSRTYAPWPVWSGSTDQPRPLRRHAQEGRRAPLAPGPRLRPRHAPARPPWRRRRPHRAAGAARADLRLPEPPHRPPGPVLRGDRRARPASACARSPRRCSGCASSGSSTGCAAAPRAGATGGSCSSRRPTPTPCCRRASGAATGRQQSRQRPRRARGANRRPCRLRSPRRPWRAICGQVVGMLASDPKDGLARALARLGRAFMARELVSFTGVHEMRRNLPILQF